ncbi:hypothetical protein B4099_0791 [Heyndrickxia coagulans]|uniref:Uncharacterized protein n=1 Tax=Heyndrickxia coagulans TaxID=1398 RepID=A0A150KE89_HEYCO|nr:hypothetical protein B4099_0791 [Heyndrickxia coagulans]
MALRTALCKKAGFREIFRTLPAISRNRQQKKTSLTCLVF